MNDKDAAARLTEYANYLSLERGLSPRSVEAYRSDIESFYAWALGQGLKPAAATRGQLDEYLWAEKKDKKLSPGRSRAGSAPCAATSPSRRSRTAGPRAPRRLCVRRACPSACPGT
ncbi:MAG: site-specific integrase [Elusimicrobiota bacterium]|nr:MAG: site-specific integrase [Elusimicrobiota bacterium]